jgi:ribosomal protein L11 methyltransferase
MKAESRNVNALFFVGQSRIWMRCDCVCDASAREAVEFGLMEAGALGTETNEFESGTRVTAYFEMSNFNTKTQFAEVETLLRETLSIYNLPPTSLEGLTWCAIKDRDWLAEWKASWQPVEVGRRFIIAPSWSEVENETNRIVVRIEPGMAFGTGTHETTRLCLHAIERYFHGASFLDVGTGTGVLAIAAAKLRPHASIEACDTDAEAVEIARRNAKANGVGERITFRVGSVDDETASADCVCANLTAETIIKILPALISATCGRLILSGILTPQIADVAARLRELGINVYQTETDGEWAAMIV